MKLKSTLRVFNETELAPGPGVVKGQSQKQLAGDPNHPTERIIVRLARLNQEPMSTSIGT